MSISLHNFSLTLREIYSYFSFYVWTRMFSITHSLKVFLHMQCILIMSTPAIVPEDPYIIYPSRFHVFFKKKFIWWDSFKTIESKLMLPLCKWVCANPLGHGQPIGDTTPKKSSSPTHCSHHHPSIVPQLGVESQGLSFLYKFELAWPFTGLVQVFIAFLSSCVQ